MHEPITQSLTADCDRLGVGLEVNTKLSEQDRAVLRALPISIRTLVPDQILMEEGDRPTHACLVLSGLLCSHKVLADGGRQIIAFWVAGEVPDLQGLHLSTMDHGINALSTARVALVPHQALRELSAGNPAVAAALWRKTLIDAAIYREWIASLGRRSAYGRIAHLICELYTRFHAAGIASDHTLPLGLTQDELGDATGLSTVHVNRILQQLRGEALIRTRGREVSILDWFGLTRAGGFDPAYLHLKTAG